MGGQQTETLDTVSIEDVEIPVELSLSGELSTQSVSDPVATFLENHGHKFTIDHEGNNITYAEAVPRCEALEMLIRALGDGALTMTASRVAAEKIEDDEVVEETEEYEDVPVKNDTGAEPGGAETEKVVADNQAEGSTTAEVDGSQQNFTISPETSKSVEVMIKTAQKYETLGGHALEPTDTVKRKALKSETKSFTARPLEVTVRQENDDKKPIILSDQKDKNLQDAITVHTASTIKPERFELSKAQKAADKEPGEIKATTSVEEDGEKEPAQGIVLEELPDSYTTEKVGTDLGKQTDFLAKIPTSSLEKEAIAPKISLPDNEILEIAENTDEQFSEIILSPSVEEEEADVIDGYSTDFIPPGNEYIQAVESFEKLELSAPMPELSLPIEEVDRSVLEFAERIEALEDEDIQAVHAVLDKIILISEENDFSTDETQIQEVQAITEDRVEKLKELFIELFDRVEMDYTPELIESFVKLAIDGKIAELAETIGEDQEDEAKADRGTHEAITRLLTAVSRIKKALLHAYDIGRSTLRLYSQRMPANT